MLTEHGKKLDGLLNQFMERAEPAALRAGASNDPTAQALWELLTIQTAVLVQIAKSINELVERREPPQ